MQSQSTWRSFLEIILQKPKTSMILVSCIIASTSAEALGITATMPLLSSLFNYQEALWKPKILSDLGLSSSAEMLIMTIIVGMAFAAKACILAVSGWVIAKSISSYSGEMRISYLSCLSRSNIQFLNRLESGKHVAILGADSMRAANAYISAFRFTAASLQVLMFACYALTLSFHVTVLALFAGIVLTIALRKLVQLSRQAGETTASSIHHMSSVAAQVARGMLDLRPMGTEHYLIRKAFLHSKNLQKAHYKSILSIQLMKSLQEPIVIMFAIFALCFMKLAVDMPGAIILLILGIFYRLLQSVSGLQYEYQNFVNQIAAVDTITSSIQGANRNPETNSGHVVLTETKRVTVEFDKVFFDFDSHPILDNFSATIPPNSVTLFMGPSGRGKSTAANLLVGLLRPNSGNISINGQDLRDIDVKSWREKIGYLGQNPFLFAGSVAENINVGRGLSEAAVTDALKRSKCWDFISALPLGIHSQINEGGSNFSGGQVQRIALARAIANEPALLILDEPTSALDDNTGAQIFKTVKDLSNDMGVIIVTHDKKANEYADNIVQF